MPFQNNLNKKTMKVTNKKDDYIVECENKKETIQVLNYLYNDNDDKWFHWRYVIKYGYSKKVFNTIPKKRSDLPVITFEEWLSLPDYKPEEVAFKPEKEITGYKLVKPEYKEAVRGILNKMRGNSIWFDLYFDSNVKEFGFNFKNNGSVYEILKKSGVLSLWFEPVYIEEEPTEEMKFIEFVSQFGFRPSEEEAKKIVEFLK